MNGYIAAMCGDGALVFSNPIITQLFVESEGSLNERELM